MTKTQLRKAFMAKRKALPAAQISTRSRKIKNRLFEFLDLSSASYVHIFVSSRSKNEIDTSSIFDEIWSYPRPVKTVVPRVNKSGGQLEHIQVDRATKMVESAWGIPEPVDGGFIDEDLIDIVLVPLLCFDLRGHRVGYGAGYYDRFLAKTRPDCKKIGLSLFDPVEVIEDTHKGDVCLDYCITPGEVFSFLQDTANKS